MRRRAFAAGVGILDELARLLGGGEEAEHVEVGAADEHGIGAEHRFDAEAGEARKDQAVDGAGGGDGRRAFVNRMAGGGGRSGGSCGDEGGGCEGEAEEQRRKLVQAADDAERSRSGGAIRREGRRGAGRQGRHGSRRRWCGRRHWRRRGSEYRFRRRPA
jgi:hypothetical protein